MLKSLETGEEFVHMCQSWIEIKYYSIAYFKRITEFDAL